MEKVSFIILTWNSGAYIQRCLRSILELSAIPYEIILVDNGSADNTIEKIAEIQQEFPEKSIIVETLDKNYGTTVSRNIGIRKADPAAAYLCILDSDTVINEASMHELVDVLKQDPKNAIAGPEMANLAGEVQLTAKKIPTAGLKLLKGIPIKALQKIGAEQETYYYKEKKRCYPVGYLISACWMLRRSVVDEIGLLDEKIFYSPEDVEYCVRAWKAGYRVLFCPAAKIIHATQRISKKKLLSRHNWEHIKGLVYFFGKYHLFFSSRGIECK